MTAHISSRNLFTHACLLLAFALGAAGCAPQAAIKTLAAEASTTPVHSQTPAPTTTPIPTATPTPLIEPALPPSQSTDPLAIHPPDNFDNALKAQVNDGDFTLVDAHAVYAYYRAEVGPSMWVSDAEFIDAMEAYATTLEAQGIELYQALDADGTTYSMLVDGTSILLNFDPSGALTFADPGYWNSDSEPRWIDAGGPVDLVVGPDNHAYIVCLDSEGNVVAWLNTLGATLDNINNQWIEVRDGQSILDWDPASRTFVENPLFTVPPEWQGRIDRLETLEDGRTVAIANPENPDQEARLRVLQLNDSGEWIAYIPEVSTINQEMTDRYFPNLELEALDWNNITRIHFQDDESQPLVPVGYLGRTYQDGTQAIWTDWVGGVIVALDEQPFGDEWNRSVAIQTQLPTGDQLILIYQVNNISQAGTTTYSLDTLTPNIDGQTIDESGLDNTVTHVFWGLNQGAIWRFIDENPGQIIGQQIAVGLTSGLSGTEINYYENEFSTREARNRVVAIIRDGEPVVDLAGLRIISFVDGVILPPELIADIAGIAR